MPAEQWINNTPEIESYPQLKAVFEGIYYSLLSAAYPTIVYFLSVLKIQAYE
jgi:hypothetical protein